MSDEHTPPHPHPMNGMVFPMSNINLYFQYCPDSDAIQASTTEGMYEIYGDTHERSQYLITDPAILNGIRLGHGLAVFDDYWKSVDYVLIESNLAKRLAFIEGASFIESSDGEGRRLLKILPEIIK